MSIFCDGTGRCVRFDGFTRLFEVNVMCIIAGWWRITSRVAGKCLWATSSTGHKLYLAGTQSLRLEIDYTTSNRIMLTSGGVDFLDTWYFIAAAFNPGPSECIWIGTEQSVPTVVGLTLAQSQSGTMVAQTALVLGSDQTTLSATSGFNGYISQVTAHGNPTSSPAFTLGSAANQAYLYERYIYPMYTGTYHPSQRTNTRINPSTRVDTDMNEMTTFIPLDTVASVSGSAIQFSADYVEYGSTANGGTGGAGRIISDGVAASTPSHLLIEPTNVARQLWMPTIPRTYLTAGL